jgi:hypothetical protein
MPYVDFLIKKQTISLLKLNFRKFQITTFAKFLKLEFYKFIFFCQALMKNDFCFYKIRELIQYNLLNKK